MQTTPTFQQLQDLDNLIATLQQQWHFVPEDLLQQRDVLASAADPANRPASAQDRYGSLGMSPPEGTGDTDTTGPRQPPADILPDIVDPLKNWYGQKKQFVQDMVQSAQDKYGQLRQSLHDTATAPRGDFSDVLAGKDIPANIASNVEDFMSLPGKLDDYSGQLDDLTKKFLGKIPGYVKGMPTQVADLVRQATADAKPKTPWTETSSDQFSPVDASSPTGTFPHIPQAANAVWDDIVSGKSSEAPQTNDDWLHAGALNDALRKFAGGASDVTSQGLLGLADAMAPSDRPEMVGPPAPKGRGSIGDWFQGVPDALKNLFNQGGATATPQSKYTNKIADLAENVLEPFSPVPPGMLTPSPSGIYPHPPAKMVKDTVTDPATVDKPLPQNRVWQEVMQAASPRFSGLPGANTLFQAENGGAAGDTGTGQPFVGPVKGGTLLPATAGGAGYTRPDEMGPKSTGSDGVPSWSDRLKSVMHGLSLDTPMGQALLAGSMGILGAQGTYGQTGAAIGQGGIRAVAALQKAKETEATNAYRTSQAKQTRDLKMLELANQWRIKQYEVDSKQPEILSKKLDSFLKAYHDNPDTATALFQNDPQIQSMFPAGWKPTDPLPKSMGEVQAKFFTQEHPELLKDYLMHSGEYGAGGKSPMDQVLAKRRALEDGSWQGSPWNKFDDWMLQQFSEGKQDNADLIAMHLAGMALPAGYAGMTDPRQIAQSLATYRGIAGATHNQPPPLPMKGEIPGGKQRPTSADNSQLKANLKTIEQGLMASGKSQREAHTLIANMMSGDKGAAQTIQSIIGGK